MKLLLATGNPAKFARYTNILAELQEPRIKLLSLHDVNTCITVTEDGATAADNARKKALAYARASALPAFSVDEALYFDALAPHDQPGTLVRRLSGTAASDEEMLSHYRAVIRRIPAERRAITWVYALCLATPTGQLYAGQIEIHEHCTDVPRLPLLPGYPLSSLLYVPEFGKNLRDLTPTEERAHLASLYAAVHSIVRAAATPAA